MIALPACPSGSFEPVCSGCQCVLKIVRYMRDRRVLPSRSAKESPVVSTRYPAGPGSRSGAMVGSPRSPISGRLRRCRSQASNRCAQNDPGGAANRALQDLSACVTAPIHHDCSGSSLGVVTYRGPLRKTSLVSGRQGAAPLNCSKKRLPFMLLNLGKPGGRPSSARSRRRATPGLAWRGGECRAGGHR